MLPQLVSQILLSSRHRKLNKNMPLAELAARYKEDGMLAYVQLVQRKEKEIGCDVLTHQKWFVWSNSSVISTIVLMLL